MKRAQEDAMLLQGAGFPASCVEVEAPGAGRDFFPAAEAESMAPRLGFLAVCKRRRRIEAEFMAAQAKRRQAERIRPEGEDASSGGLLLAPSTPSRKLPRLARREADLDAPQDFVNLLPEALALKIFSKVPPRAIASKCSLICKSWARLAAAEGLWKDFCTPSGLTECDTTKVLGGWRGLFAAAFASNLVQSSHFERYQENEPAADLDEEPSAFQARAKVLVERLLDTDTVEMEYRCRSHWTDDVEGLELLPSRVNGAFRTRVTAQSLSQSASPSCPGWGVGVGAGAATLPEAHAVEGREATGNGAALDEDPASIVPASPPALAQTSSSSAEDSACRGQSSEAGDDNSTGALPAAAGGGVALGGAWAVGATADAGAAAASSLSPLHDGLNTRPQAGTEAIRTAPRSWGRLQQTISLAAFPGRFLDACAPIRVSAWCARNLDGEGEAGVASEFRIQLVLCAHDGSPLHHWDSGNMDWSNPGWRCFAALVRGYPQGVRSVIVRVAGKGVDYTKVQANFSPME